MKITFEMLNKSRNVTKQVYKEPIFNRSTHVIEAYEL